MVFTNQWLTVAFASWTTFRSTLIQQSSTSHESHLELAGGAEAVMYTWHESERPPKLTVRSLFEHGVFWAISMSQSSGKKCPRGISEEREAQICRTFPPWMPSEVRKQMQAQVSGSHGAQRNDKCECQQDLLVEVLEVDGRMAHDGKKEMMNVKCFLWVYTCVWTLNV